MFKKVFKGLLATTVAVTTLVGCGGTANTNPAKEPAQANEAPAADTKGADKTRELVISTWGLSEDLLWENVFKPFEEEYNVKIVLEIGNNAERLTKLKNNPNSNIDIMYLAEAYAAQGVDSDLFEAIDYSQIETAKLSNKQAQTKIEEGFGPAYTLNSIGIVVAPNAGVEIKEWADLWSEELVGKIAIPDITTTFGPAMMQIAAEKAGTTLESDGGVAAFAQLEALKPNVVKTYSKSSDLANMFASGEIVAAIAADFAFGTIVKATPDVQYIVPESGTYLNFNTININKQSPNKDLALQFINYALSTEVQTRAAKALGDSPVNTEVTLTEEEAGNLTYGNILENAKTLDYKVINPLMTEWINTWNQLMN